MVARNGRMAGIPQTANPTLLLGATYDAWNRLVKLVDDSDTVAEYEYDGRNYRIVKKVYVDGTFDHDEHQYLSDSNQVLEVRHDSSTTAVMQNVWGERYIDDLILRDRTTTNPLDERLYCLQDANWNTVALVDDGGSVAQRFDYQPYGECTFLTNSFGASTNLYEWTTLFTGRELDLEFELYYFRARYLHAKIGTFLSRDPLGYIDGMSLVRAWFVPNGVDPLGTVTVKYEPAESDEEHPWIDASISWKNVLGRTSATMKAECGCTKVVETHLLEYNGVIGHTRQKCDVSYEMNCTLTSVTSITIDTKKIAELGDPKVTIEGTYGHEQRHVISNRTAVQRAATTISKYEGRYSTMKECGQKARGAEKEARNVWSPLFWADQGEAHSQPFPLSPAKNVQYRPLKLPIPSPSK